MQHYQKILFELKRQNGQTALQIAKKCNLINVSARITDLRKNGVNIISKYHGTDKSGSRMWRYWLIGYQTNKLATKNAIKY